MPLLRHHLVVSITFISSSSKLNLSNFSSNISITGTNGFILLWAVLLSTLSISLLSEATAEVISFPLHVNTTSLYCLIKLERSLSVFGSLKRSAGFSELLELIICLFIASLIFLFLISLILLLQIHRQ